MLDPHLAQADPEVAQLVAAEERREFDKIRLIPSENYASRAVLEATGSVFTNKYSEGYAGKRYYEGQQCVDPLEQLAIARIDGCQVGWGVHPIGPLAHAHGDTQDQAVDQLLRFQKRLRAIEKRASVAVRLHIFFNL